MLHNIVTALICINIYEFGVSNKLFTSTVMYINWHKYFAFIQYLHVLISVIGLIDAVAVIVLNLFLCEKSVLDIT